MKRMLFLLCLIPLLHNPLSSAAQSKTKKPTKQVLVPEVEVIEEEVEMLFVPVEESPSFPGGPPEEFRKWLMQQLLYPVVAQENGIMGKVIAWFDIMKDGSIDNVRIIRSVDPSIDKEVIRCIKKSPKWIPAKQNGVPCRSGFAIAINFKLI